MLCFKCFWEIIKILKKSVKIVFYSPLSHEGFHSNHHQRIKSTVCTFISTLKTIYYYLDKKIQNIKYNCFKQTKIIYHSLQFKVKYKIYKSTCFNRHRQSIHHSFNDDFKQFIIY